MRPEISIILPVYNGAGTVGGAIQSVLAQTCRDFELLVINDGSTDESTRIVKSIQDSRIRLLDLKQNVGRSAARNKGIEEARGSLVAMIDADDYWYPKRLEVQADFMAAHPEISLCGAWGRLCQADGSTLEWKQPVDPAAIRAAILWINPFIHCSLLVRKDALTEAGLYDPRLHFSEDYDLCLRIVSRRSAANVPQFLVRYQYRTNPDYRRRDEFGKFRARWRALWRYGYPKSRFLCLAFPLVTALLPVRLTLWLKPRLSALLGRGR